MTFRRGQANFALLFCLFALALGHRADAQPDRVVLRGQRPATLAGWTPKERMPATSHVSLAIGLPIRDQAGLNELQAQLYNPTSANFHKFLTPPEFAARFGPTESDYQAVIDFAEANSLTVSARHINRLVLDVEGNASDVERAFRV